MFFVDCVGVLIGSVVHLPKLERIYGHFEIFSDIHEKTELRADFM